MEINGYAIKRGADLRKANLQGADLQGADLRRADLREANLWRANLQWADLRRANLQGADLREASLWKADLREANLHNAQLPPFQLPQGGELIVWKKVTSGIAKLRVPPEAKRTASLVGRKCRASFVEVLELAHPGTSTSIGNLTGYRQGEIVRPDWYDDDIRVECTHGIHFFLTREEAEEWE